jgi:predicted nucleic acid-binding protein
LASLAREPHVERAFRLAREMKHAVYDCIYLALAVHHDTHVITADRRFAEVAARSGFAERVRLLAA